MIIIECHAARCRAMLPPPRFFADAAVCYSTCCDVLSSLARRHPPFAAFSPLPAVHHHVASSDFFIDIILLLPSFRHFTHCRRHRYARYRFPATMAMSPRTQPLRFEFAEASGKCVTSLFYARRCYERVDHDARSYVMLPSALRFFLGAPRVALCRYAPPVFVEYVHIEQIDAQDARHARYRCA